MKLKLTAMVVLSVMALGTAYAADPKNDKPAKAENTQAADQAKVMEKLRNTYTQTVIDCEMDTMCVYKKIEELSQKDPDFKQVFAELSSQKKAIDEENQNCSDNAQYKDLRKELTVCLKEAFANKDKEQAEIEKSARACNDAKLEALAKKGNIFALTELADQAKKAGNQEKAKEWSDLLEKQKTTEDYKKYEKCDKAMH
jgi:hypothetical protein